MYKIFTNGQHERRNFCASLSGNGVTETNDTSHELFQEGDTERSPQSITDLRRIFGSSKNHSLNSDAYLAEEKHREQEGTIAYKREFPGHLKAFS